MRDYEMIVFQSVGPGASVPERHLRLVFRNCVEANVRTRVRPDVWTTSLDDTLIDEHRATLESVGYVWGVESQVLYPGASVVEPSARAGSWSESIGIPFFEVDMEANAHHINLIFADLIINEIAGGYAPFQVGNSGIPEAYERSSKMPLRPDAS